MDVHLTPDQRAFVRQAIDSGRLRGEEDAVKEALSLWEERERGRAITQESMRELAQQVTQRGKAGMAAELSSELSSEQQMPRR